MKNTALILSLMALALTACGRKDETPPAAPAQQLSVPAPAAAAPAPTSAPAENAGEGVKPATAEATPPLNAAAPEQK